MTGRCQMPEGPGTRSSNVSYSRSKTPSRLRARPRPRTANTARASARRTPQAFSDSKDIEQPRRVAHASGHRERSRDKVQARHCRQPRGRWQQRHSLWREGVHRKQVRKRATCGAGFHWSACSQRRSGRRGVMKPDKFDDVIAHRDATTPSHFSSSYSYILPAITIEIVAAKMVCRSYAPVHPIIRKAHHWWTSRRMADSLAEKTIIYRVGRPRDAMD